VLLKLLFPLVLLRSCPYRRTATCFAWQHPCARRPLVLLLHHTSCRRRYLWSPTRCHDKEVRQVYQSRDITATQWSWYKHVKKMTLRIRCYWLFVSSWFKRFLWIWTLAEANIALSLCTLLHFPILFVGLLFVSSVVWWVLSTGLEMTPSSLRSRRFQYFRQATLTHAHGKKATEL
jgi:hypothetical protein